MKRLYILTRNDLGNVYKKDDNETLFDPSYQAVQGAHAVAQFMMDYPDNEWKNGYLIFLAVEDEGELYEWLGELNYQNGMKSSDKKMPISIFKEPDLDNQLTAIAVYTNGRMFKKLPIMAQRDNNVLAE
jgi:hypothetical protein